MKKIYKIQEVRKILNSKQEVNLKCWTKDGGVLIANNVVCTSTNYATDTANIKFMISNEIRKIRIILIFELNGKEVFI